MKVQLLSTDNGMKSASLKRLAVELSQQLGYKVFRTTTQRPKRKQFRYGDAVDKLTQYKYFQEKGLSALEFTTNTGEAFAWWHDGHSVFGRKLLNAHSGKGIVVFEPGGQHPTAVETCPVYTKYKPKKREFRVHIFKENVVAIVEKKLRAGQPAHKVRNLANGYVFCQGITLDDALRQRISVLALAAAKVCASDFRGVDLGYNEKKDDLFVIEVNSAPGIEGSNVKAYVKEMRKYIK